MSTSVTVKERHVTPRQDSARQAAQRGGGVQNVTRVIELLLHTFYGNCGAFHACGFL